MSRDPSGDWERAFRPKMGRGRQGVEPAAGLTMRRAVLQRLAARARQRTAIVVKASYVRLAGGGAKAARAHLGYIERDGVERDGSPGQMFDANGDVGRKEFAAPIEGEKRQFRFIIAPEDGDELDLRRYTRDLVERMEKDLGRGLRWAAVCHYNTDNPHVHLVVRGVDTQDRELRIDRTYLSESLRLRAQELATKELGPRTELDMRRQLDREVSQERLTRIDRALAPPHLGRPDHPDEGYRERCGRPQGLAVPCDRTSRRARETAARRTHLADLLALRGRMATDAQGSRRARRHHQANAPRARRPRGRPSDVPARAGCGSRRNRQTEGPA